MNYPGGIRKKQENTVISYKNRGMTLERELNSSNLYYKEENIAYIYKKPTPIKLVQVDYLKSLLLQIIMVYIKANILILRQKKLLIRHLFH